MLLLEKVRREEAHVKGHGEREGERESPDGGSKMARDGKCKVEERGDISLAAK